MELACLSGYSDKLYRNLIAARTSLGLAFLDHFRSEPSHGVRPLTYAETLNTIVVTEKEANE